MEGVMKRYLVASCLFLVAATAMATPPVVETREFTVRTEDGVSIAVRHKLRPHGSRGVPVLLVHGTWGNSREWDFPGRSVMDYLAVRGYDAYALDLRGMGNSERPASYFDIGLLDRVRDVAAVAGQILASTGRRPVVVGFSQGGLLAGLLAASAPHLVEGVGLFGTPADGYFIPPAFEPLIADLVSSGVDRFFPPPDVLYAIGFGFDPVTGRPTIGADAFAGFLAISEADSARVILEQASPEFFQAEITPAWPNITAPALVVDGAQDLLVGEARARALYEALGSERKELVILGRNAHVWFIEDNFHATLRAFNAFLAQF